MTSLTGGIYIILFGKFVVCFKFGSVDCKIYAIDRCVTKSLHMCFVKLMSFVNKLRCLLHFYSTRGIHNVCGLDMVFITFKMFYSFLLTYFISLYRLILSEKAPPHTVHRLIHPLLATFLRSTVHQAK